MISLMPAPRGRNFSLIPPTGSISAQRDFTGHGNSFFTSLRVNAESEQSSLENRLRVRLGMAPSGTWM